MGHMSDIDHLTLDGHTLKTLLTILEEGSVSRAAERLFVSQSAVSHTLKRLRKLFDDPLFIRVGRGVEPTPRAMALRAPLESLLANLRSLTLRQDFDPLREEMEFTVAANDFPVRLIFPGLLRELSDEGVKIRVRFIPSGIPSAATLQASRYRLLITPTPPDDPKLVKVSLVKSQMAVFYDPSVRKPPTSWAQYVASKRVEVRFSDIETSIMALRSVNASELGDPVVTVPNFGTLASMIRGTDRITTQLEVMKKGLLGDLEVAPLPARTKKVDLFLIWHQREHDDPAHEWFRGRIVASMNSLLEG